VRRVRVKIDVRDVCVMVGEDFRQAKQHSGLVDHGDEYGKNA
jgi:hypothetical protein